MRILVTAGNTQTPIDTVRCITNIFTGRTGAAIAAEAMARGHTVDLATSHPDTAPAGATVWPYRTYSDLAGLMAREIPGAGYGAIVHSAAVSDYEVRNILTPVSDFHDASMAFHGPGPHFRDSRQSKVKSSHPEVWLRMVPTAKLVDSIRKEWNFRGVLVKFKLEVGVTDAELLAVAERSRVQSGAEILVANTFEGRHDWAYLLTDTSSPYRVNRSALAHTLMDAVEQRHR